MNLNLQKMAAIIVAVVGIMCCAMSCCKVVTLARERELDIKISEEVITQRQYSSAAITDGYDIEILTEKNYKQASMVAKRYERCSRERVSSLFKDKADESLEEKVKLAALNSGLFGGKQRKRIDIGE